MRPQYRPQLDTNQIIERLIDGIEDTMKAKRFVQAHRNSGFMSRSVSFCNNIDVIDNLANESIELFNQQSRLIRGIPVRLLLDDIEQSARIFEFIPGDTQAWTFAYQRDGADPSTTTFHSITQLREAHRAQAGLAFAEELLP